jgi:uncharacterized protein (DUF433 family)
MVKVDTPGAISKDPERYGGAACIRDTRIPVCLLVNYRRLGGSVADLLRNYPSLNPADLECAWAYNATHVEEIAGRSRRTTNEPNRWNEPTRWLSPRASTWQCLTRCRLVLPLVGIFPFTGTDNGTRARARLPAATRLLPSGVPKKRTDTYRFPLSACPLRPRVRTNLLK